MTTTTTSAPATVADAAPKRDWHAATTLQVRRRVLLQILLLLKTKYGHVDAKISFIARRAELALYSQAFSLLEYRNPKTLHRRLHSLVVKLHMNNLAAREDHLFGVEGADHDQRAESPPPQLCTPANSSTISAKRKRADAEWAAPSISPRESSKRVRKDRAAAQEDKQQLVHESALFFDGNRDLRHHVCSFLAARDQLQLAATNAAANKLVPSFVSRIRVSVPMLETLAPAARTSFFDRFENLEQLEVFGDAQSHLHFDFQNQLALVLRNVVCRSLLVALARRPLPRLRRVAWHYAFVDGVNDRITSQMATVLLDTTKFPLLAELSLVGNAVADDGVAFLCEALQRPTQPPRALRVLNLEQNFVGERGCVELARLVASSEQLRLTSSRGEAPPLVVRLNGNLHAAASR